MPTLNDVLAGSLAQAVQLQQVIDALKGTPNKGVPVALIALSDANNYALTVRNNDAVNSRALSVLAASGAPLITADITGVTLGSPLHIPAGSIGSAEIADGTIATADIAAGAIHQIVFVQATTANPTTTSASFVDLADMTATLTTTGGRVLAFLVGQYTVTAVSGGVITQGLSLDAAAEAGAQGEAPSGLNVQISIFAMADLGTPTAASHTIKGRWAVGGGSTASAIGVNRRLLVIEFKK
jgi:hypothetical protein